jgi:hypothetical protein
LIEQSCAFNQHGHTHRTLSGLSWSSRDIESVNIFVLAVTYGRYGFFLMLYIFSFLFIHDFLEKQMGPY